jgi:hypothetical protein
MNRRHFLALGGAGAVAATMTHRNIALAAQTSAFYVKGLILVSFEDPRALRIGLPKATGHKATLSMTPYNGSKQVANLKGMYTVETSQSLSAKPEYKIPELIRMQEIYGNQIHSRVQDCPTVISIPYAAIRSITAVEVSPTRYTFVRADNGQEIMSFRPRKIAETLKIELVSDALMKLNGGKSSVNLNTMQEVHAEYEPENAEVIEGMDPFTAHFSHYNAYLDRPMNANFDVLPKNLGPSGQATPRTGNNFMTPLWPVTFCFIVSC